MTKVGGRSDGLRWGVIALLQRLSVTYMPESSRVIAVSEYQIKAYVVHRSLTPFPPLLNPALDGCVSPKLSLCPRGRIMRVYTKFRHHDSLRATTDVGNRRGRRCEAVLYCHGYGMDSRLKMHTVVQQPAPTLNQPSK